MGKLIDLTGKKFGKWTVIKRADNINGSTRWQASCDCGFIKDVNSRDFLSGQSKGCRQCQTNRETKDITGLKFGNWMVVRVDSVKSRKFARGLFWLCKCLCGTKRSILGGQLRNGSAKMCRSCIQIKANTDEMIGRKFYKWTVVGWIREKDKRGRSEIFYRCVCKCGNESHIKKNTLINLKSSQCQQCFAKSR